MCSAPQVPLDDPIRSELLWFVIFPYLHLSYFWLIVIGEGFAFLAEAAHFAFPFRRRRALLWSALANTASFSTGMLSRRLFGMP